MLPDSDEVAVGLDAIALAPGRLPVEGKYHTGYGVIDICAWPRGLWDYGVPSEHVADHEQLLDLLGVDYRHGNDGYEVRWTPSQARAYQLMRILPHELGHHHDLITSQRQHRAGRGESYAEAYALRILEDVWPIYARRFEV
jgi:hypothetical protein